MNKIEREIFKLIQNFIRKNKIKGSNYTDYDKIPKCTMCSYVDLHSDLDFGVTERKPYFHIKPLYWSKTGSLVHQYRHKWYKTKFNGSIIKFNALRDHGLVPDAVADRLVTENKVFENKWLSTASFTSGDVKLVWIWLTEKEVNNPKLLEDKLNEILINFQNLEKSKVINNCNQTSCN